MTNPRSRIIDGLHRHVVAPAWRRAIAIRAASPQPGFESRSALVVAPHPDDETFGCGATIASKCAAGADVTVVIAADGRHAQPHSEQVSAADLAALRRVEASKACARLGVDDNRLLQLGIEDTLVEFAYDQLVDRVRSIIRSEQPDDIFTTCDRDWHIDHRSVSRAVRTAAAAEGRTRIFEYPIWWWIDGPRYPRAGRSRLARFAHMVSSPFESVLSVQPLATPAGPHLESKRAAVSEYVSQTTNMTGEEGWYVMEKATTDLFLGEREIHFLVDRLDGIDLRASAAKGA